MSAPSDPSAALAQATLAAEHDFVRRLAGALLRDGHDADDLAQATWLRARTASPGDRRGFLGTVARNLARNLHRDRRRRLARERSAARSEALPSTTELLEFEARRQRVVAAVLGLSEPYRGTVVAVYFEERKPRDLARELGIPAATVRSRLHRAHALLRERLRRDAEDGDWARLVTPLACLGGGSVLTWLGGGIAVKKALFVVLVLAGLAWPCAALLDTDAVVDGPAVEQPVADRTGALEVTGGAGAGQRERLAVATDRPASPTSKRMRATLSHADGSPAGDLPYWVTGLEAQPDRRRRQFFEPPAGQRTGSDGSFQWSPADRVVWCRLDAAHDVAIPVAAVDDGAAIVLPPRAAVVVQCVGATTGAELSCSSLPAWLDADGRPGHAWTWVTTTADTGRTLHFHRRATTVTATAVDGRAAVHLRVPAWQGFHYQLRTSGSGLRLDADVETVRAPAQLLRNVVGRVATVQVRVVEADRRTLTGRPVLLLKDAAGDTSGHAICVAVTGGKMVCNLDWTRPGATARIRVVVVEDGEWFERRLDRPGPDGGAVELVRGTGRAAIRLPVPAGAWSHMYLQAADRVQRLELLVAESGYAPGQLLYLVDRDGDLRIPGPLPVWTRMFAIDAGGRVARLERAMSADGFRVLPVVRHLQPFEVAAYARQHPELDAFQVAYEVRPAGLGPDQWLAAGVANWSRSLANPPVVWRKVVSAGVDYRFVLRVAGSPPRVIDAGR